MSYENKEYILQFFEGVHEEDNKAELIEVYRKAKAFESIAGIVYWHFERIHPDDANVLQYKSFYDDIRDEFKKLESGEPNAKK